MYRLLRGKLYHDIAGSFCVDKLEKLALSQVLEKATLFKAVFFDCSILACSSAKEGKSAIWTCNVRLVPMG